MSENQIGICSDKGNGNDTPCCKKKPLCDHPCESGCQSSNPRDTSKTCSQAGLLCCGPTIPVVGGCNSAGESCVMYNLGCQTTEQRKSSGDAWCSSADSSKPYCCEKKVAGGPADCTATPKPAGCTGTPVPGSSASIPFSNPLKFTTVEGALGGLLGALQGIIVVLSLVFIVIGAVLYITSAGDDGRMKTAKGAITASMIGLAIGIAAPSFLKQIASILGWNTTEASLTGAKTLTEIALNVLQFLLSIVGILGIIMLVIGGIMYLTAAGDEHRIDSGKEIVKYSIIGIAVALAALVIVTQIAGLIA